MRRIRMNHKSKGIGLLAIWVSAIAALFALYVLYQILTPILGELDYQVYSFITTSGLPFSSTWLAVYNQMSPFMAQTFTYLLYIAFISICIFVLVQSARRRTDEYEEQF